jgi:uncharacterized protein YkwD
LVWTVPSDRRRRPRLHLEELESRLVLSGVPPTAVEQLFLEELNEARANPAAYGAAIGVDLSGVAPSQPLAFDSNMIGAARLHSQDMNDYSFFDHINLAGPRVGQGPGERLDAAGVPWTSWGESIAAGYATPADALAGLIVDQGVADLGHRRQLLAIDALFKSQNEVGIGIVQGGSGPYQNYYTIDTAATTDTRPILTGVVFKDSNHNGQYDLNEGLGGVTVTVAGVGTTTTWGSGGYSLPLSPGTYTVIFSGGGLASPVVRVVTVGAVNVRLNVSAPPASSGTGTGTESVAVGPAGLVTEEVFGDGTLVQVDATGAHVVGPNVRSAVIAFNPTNGQAVLEVVSLNGQLTQYDVTGVHPVGPGVRSVSLAYSPGGQAVLEVITLDGTLVQYDPWGVHLVGPNVQTASIAFSPSGQAVLEVVALNGTQIQYDPWGVHLVGPNVQTASIAFSATGTAILEVVSRNGFLLQYDATGVHVIGSNTLFASVTFPPSGAVLDVIFQDGTLDRFDPTGVHQIAKLF